MSYRVKYYVDAYNIFCLFDPASASISIVLFSCHLAIHSASLTVNQLSVSVEGVLQQ